MLNISTLLDGLSIVLKSPLLALYWTWYFDTPACGIQSRIIFGTAVPLIITIFSDAVKPSGGSFTSVSVVIFLVGKAVPSSTNAYLPESCDKAVIEKVLSSFSFTLTTLQVVVWSAEVSKINVACWFGAALKAEDTVIVVPEILLIVFCSKLPSG